MPADPESGRLVAHLLLFARTLRAAGLAIGPGHVLDAIEAMRAVGIERRDDLYWALHAVFVTRRDQHALFDQAFHIIWRNPRLLDRLMAAALPGLTHQTEALAQTRIARRLAEALHNEPGIEESESEATRDDLDATLTWSDQDTLRTMDFEQMSQAESEAAKRAIAMLRLPRQEVRTRRYIPAQRAGKPDLRRTLQAAMRGNRDTIPLKYKRQRTRTRPIVVLCDISGSMAQYARMILHFMHTLIRARDRVHSFVFGTHLTNITPYLRYRDVDEALAKVGHRVTDWQGGTRIGTCLHEFNRLWSRRVLGQGAIVLLISDGLDRENAAGMAHEMAHLHRASRRLIWLNPLLRYSGYAPKSQGARAMIPHVDALRPIHNLASLETLAAILNQPLGKSAEGVEQWRRMLT